MIDAYRSGPGGSDGAKGFGALEAAGAAVEAGWSSGAGRR